MGDLWPDPPKTVAALFVAENGVYWDAPGVDPWTIREDARTYEGPYPVVAHPPCQRWGRYWSGGPNPKAERRLMGDDGGCFAAALWAVRSFGGVLEHPEASHAWRWFGLNRPDRAGGWSEADTFGGWTCQVEQGHYGHRARKKTWLYCVPKSGLRFLDANVYFPQLRWGESSPGGRLEPGYHSAEEARAARSAPGYTPMPRPTQRENEATPQRFAAVLLDIARACAAD